MDRRYAPGVLLIVLGVALLLTRQQVLRGEVTVLVIGAALLVAYAFTQSYGLLVPGGILTGLGAGIALREWAAGGGVLLGLGVGFFLIYVLDRARGGGGGGGAGTWPIIPGGILIVIGLLQAARSVAALQALWSWWPVALIALGVWLVVRRWGPA